MNNLSGIRVTYSGLISFAIGLASIFTGLIFTLIVTRSLTPDEFGTWSLIGSLIIYVIIIEPVIAYWTTRETARGIYSGRTAVFSSSLFSAGGVLAYIVIAYYVGIQANADTNILIFASILVPLMFLNRTLTAINLGWKPQVASYGFLVIEISKIPSALVLVYFLDMGLSGAIITTAIAHFASIIVLIIYARDKIKAKFKIEFLKKWIKLSWLPIYPGVASLVFVLDVMVFSVITGSVEGVAFWAAALAITSVAAHSKSISNALYPKLLEGGKKIHLQENLAILFYFAIPLTALSIVFAKPGLFALNPLYGGAVLVVIFLTLRAFLSTLSILFGQALSGIEKVDVNEKSTFKQYVKSKLFLVPTLQLIQYSLYVGILVVILLMFRSSLPQLDLVIYWSLIALFVQIPFTIYFYRLAGKNFDIKIDRLGVIKYLLVSVVVFGIVFVLMDKFLEYKQSIFEFLPAVLFYVVLAVGSYLAITYVIDSRTRNLFNKIIQEIKGTTS